MNILLSPYVLKRKDNSGDKEGVLLKVTEDNFFGIADICPHLHLGDVSWTNEVKQEGPLYRRALDLASEDLRARKQKRSLLSDKKILNNYLIIDFENSDLNDTRYFQQTLKIKGSRNIGLLSEKLNAINIDVKIRLDFNAQLTELEFSDFLSRLSQSLHKKIEYIEDPAPLGPIWKEWNKIVPLASDWEKTEDTSLARYRVCKPAREKIPEGISDVVLTSAMDHPIGIAHGLRLAQQFAMNVCGFSTLGMYAPNVFEKYFEANGPWLSFSKAALNDSGIGMTESIQELHWTPAAETLS